MVSRPYRLWNVTPETSLLNEILKGSVTSSRELTGGGQPGSVGIFLRRKIRGGLRVLPHSIRFTQSTQTWTLGACFISRGMVFLHIEQKDHASPVTSS